MLRAAIFVRGASRGRCCCCCSRCRWASACVRRSWRSLRRRRGLLHCAVPGGGALTGPPPGPLTPEAGARHRCEPRAWPRPGLAAGSAPDTPSRLLRFCVCIRDLGWTERTQTREKLAECSVLHLQGLRKYRF